MERKLQEMKVSELMDRFGKLLVMTEHIEKIPTIIKTLCKIEEAVYAKNMDDYLDSFIPFDEVTRMLGISKRSFFSLRKKGSISFVKIGKKVFITKGMLNEFIDAHTIKASNSLRL